MMLPRLVRRVRWTIPSAFDVSASVAFAIGNVDNSALAILPLTLFLRGAWQFLALISEGLFQRLF